MHRRATPSIAMGFVRTHIRGERVDPSIGNPPICTAYIQRRMNIRATCDVQMFTLPASIALEARISFLAIQRKPRVSFSLSPARRGRYPSQRCGVALVTSLLASVPSFLFSSFLFFFFVTSTIDTLAIR